MYQARLPGAARAASAPPEMPQDLLDHFDMERMAVQTPPFDQDEPHFELLEKDAAVQEPSPAANPVIKRKITKIARAITGASEIRLLDEEVDGVHRCWVIEVATLCPYEVKRKEAEPVARRRKLTQIDTLPPESQSQHRVMTLKEAIASFEFEVRQKYPSIKLATCVVPTHQILL